ALARKQELRASLRSLRNEMTQEGRKRASESITRDLLALERYKAARTVLAYMSFDTEFSTDRFVRQTLDDSKSLVLPRIDRTRNQLELRAVRDLDAELVPGLWGIREPNAD